MLEAIAGHDPSDPTSLDIEVTDYTASLKSGIQGIRIGVDADYISEGVEVPLSKSIQNAIKILGDLRIFLGMGRAGACTPRRPFGSYGRVA
jgi:Asp-tRNA(Asn)/Glu-tRNA(Gln) amidotransferase A subunit family amidase